MKIKLLFAWYDLWIGLFYDKNKNWLYILPIPMFGIILKLPHQRYFLIDKNTNTPIGSHPSYSIINHYKDQNEYIKMYWCKNGTDEPLFHKNLS